MNRLKAALPLTLILAAAGGVAALLGRSAAGRSVELKALDWRFRTLSRPERADKRIVLVMVDQGSLDAFEKDSVYWPWPRSVYQALLGFLKKGGAKAVVFDALYTNPSPYGAAEDAEFGKALKAFGPSVLAMETGRNPSPRRTAAPPARFALASAPAGAAAAEARSVRLPVPELAAGAAALGDTTIAPDPDGVFRRVPLAASMGGRLYPTLPAAAAMAYSGKTLDALAPRLADGRLIVRFHGKSLTRDPALKTYDFHSAGDLILGFQALEEGRKPALDPAVFKDKLVLVGLSAAGLFDNRASPVASVFPGTEVIAAAADNLLNGDGLAPAGRAASALALLLALLAAGLAARLPGRGWEGAAAALGASALLAGAALLAFDRGVWLDMTTPQLALWLGFAGASAYGYAVEGRQKRYIQGAFSYYLSPEVVRRIAERPDALALGGERREATFYFSDIEGFTSFSEKLDPESLTKLMNRYLGEMTETILSSGGTLDKYIGDAIMAFWGAPLPCEGHALIACRTALANQKRLESLREEFARAGYPPVRNRIGLHSGPASIGNMGSSKRFSYTAIGDNVNLASRLEGANKAYGSYILISEAVREGAGGAIETRELDFVKVKGKNLPIRVYELLGLAGETPESLRLKARAFEAALALYRGRRFDEAEAAFGAVKDRFGEDHACDVYQERCREAKADPPPADWDGSHALTEK